MRILVSLVKPGISNVHWWCSDEKPQWVFRTPKYLFIKEQLHINKNRKSINSSHLRQKISSRGKVISSTSIFRIVDNIHILHLLQFLPMYFQLSHYYQHSTGQGHVNVIKREALMNFLSTKWVFCILVWSSQADHQTNGLFLWNDDANLFWLF